MARLKLHHFHSSSTSFRVRIALGLKQLEWEGVPVTLRWQGGDHDGDEFKRLNPQANVPVLVDGDVVVQQSLAIIDYLEQRFPQPALMPPAAAERARVLSLAQHVACEIQPMNNLRVQRHLAGQYGLDPPRLKEWQRHWTAVGFDALERQLNDDATGSFCHGDSATVADCFLVPQVYNALRPAVGFDLQPWPRIARVYEHCLQQPAFERALPVHQPGFEELAQH